MGDVCLGVAKVIWFEYGNVVKKIDLSKKKMKPSLKHLTLTIITNEPYQRALLPNELANEISDLRLRLRPLLIKYVDGNVVQFLDLRRSGQHFLVDKKTIPIAILKDAISSVGRCETRFVSFELFESQDPNDRIMPTQLTESAREALNRFHPTFYKPTRKFHKSNPHIDLIYKKINVHDEPRIHIKRMPYMHQFVFRKQKIIKKDL